MHSSDFASFNCLLVDQSRQTIFDIVVLQAQVDRSLILTEHDFVVELHGPALKDARREVGKGLLDLAV